MTTLVDAPQDRPAVPSVRAIFEDHAAFVLRLLRRLGVPDRDLNDQAQEVFVVVHRKHAQLQTPDGVRPWLFVIARGVASDYRRRAHVRRELPGLPAVEPAAPVRGADVELDRKKARALLEAALEALDHEKREVFVLYELEQMPMKDIAEAVGCPLQTAYSRLHAAREMVEKTVRRATRDARRQP